MEIKNNQNRWLLFQPYIVVLLLLGMASAFGYLFRVLGFPETNMVVIYLLAVLLTSRFTNGYLFGVLASIGATLAFNYFFTKPYFTLSVDDPSYIVTFVIMTITAIVTSALTSKVKLNAEEAQEKERETRALYLLTNHLTNATDIHEIANIAVEIISETLACEAACLCTDERGKLETTFVQQTTKDKQIHRATSNAEALKIQMINLTDDYAKGAEFWEWPIHGQETLLGVVRIPRENAMKMNEAQRRILKTMIESIALAMDRFLQIKQRIKSNEEAVQERYRGNLLRAISHDLRTPLSGIMGTSEMLMDMTEKADDRYALAKGIYKDADWLRALVENILNLTKLQEGKLVLNREIEVVEEVVGGAISHMSRRLSDCEIIVQMPEKLLMIPMDAKLIQQVLINLLDNAIKHAEPGSDIYIVVQEEEKEGYVTISVIDHGEGIPETDLPNIFQMFYTSKTRRPDTRHGIGLGLAICQAIVEAHGGTIKAENLDSGRGSIFSFQLPNKECKNEPI